MMKKILVASLLAFALAQPSVALNTEEWLSLVAMPLAVAAVSELTEVPPQDLITLVTALNQAQVPPPQFIEVVRFVPVVLVDQTASPEFITFVTTQVNQGVTGDALAVVIADRLRTFGLQEINVVSPPPALIVVEQRFIPPVVVTRVAQIKQHPHGGPPGQLKKAAGVQTGAEIVHGTKPGRSVTMVPERAPKVDKGRGPGRPAVGIDQRQDKGNPGKGNPGKGNPGKGKGKGKGD
jgi:hypothetical protein